MTEAKFLLPITTLDFSRKLAHFGDLVDSDVRNSLDDLFLPKYIVALVHMYCDLANATHPTTTPKRSEHECLASFLNWLKEK